MHPFSYLLNAGAPIITSEAFIGTIVAALIAWSVASGLRLRRGQRQVVADLNRATETLSGPDNPIEFSENFEAINKEISDIRLLRSAWLGFQETLIIPRSLGRPIASTIKPNSWFDLASLFRESDTDLRYHAALPGLLVGTGLLCTFLGLAVALTVAGSVVAGGSSNARLDALHTLLDAASVKFITSLFGLLCSILYALWRKYMLYGAEKAYSQFVDAVRRQMPLKSAAALQADANDLLERQYSEVQRIGSDFFVNLGSTLEREFSNGLQEHIAPLAAAIEKLTGSLAGQNEGAVGTMLSAFLERLEGAVGESMRGTAATLQTLESRLEGLRGAMDDAASRMGRAAEEMATGMGKGTQDALGGISEQMGALVQSMRQAAEEAGNANRVAGEDLALRMAGAAEGITRAVDLFQRNMEQGAAQGVERLNAPIEAMLKQLNEMATSQRNAGASAASDLAETVGRAASALELTAGRIASVLGDGASNASDRLVAATEAMRDDLRNVLERFGRTLADAGSSVEEGARAGGATLATAANAFGGDIAAAAVKLSEAGDAAGAALRGGGSDARAQMGESARILADGANLLNNPLAAIALASEGLAERTATLQAAIRDTAVPLQATAVDLRSTASAVREAVMPLAETAQVMRSTLDSLRGATETVSDANRQADALASRLGEATTLFRGVDQALSASTDKLAQGILEMERQVSTFVRGIDSNLANSVKGLHAIAQELEAVAESLAASRGGRGDNR